MQTVILPNAPKTGSPVPHLTSIHSNVKRGPYGDWRYPGNCSGQIIKDLLQYFQPKSVFDPMTGSGTCKDVCKELGIECVSGDVRKGFDAASPEWYVDTIKAGVTYDFVWLHPPYWRMKKYSDDPRCLSNAPDMEHFYLKLRKVIGYCKDVLSEKGKIAILMGDYQDRQLGRMAPCVHMTKEAALREKLWPACTDIIRFQHGNTSSHREYTSSFIPGLHDTCMVFKKAR